MVWSGTYKKPEQASGSKPTKPGHTQHQGEEAKRPAA